MKKLVTTPLTRTIYWATVDDKRGLITGEKKDVTDNAVECVLNHFIYSKDFEEKGFTGYTYNKSDGEGKLVICAYDIGKEYTSELDDVWPIHAHSGIVS